MYVVINGKFLDANRAEAKKTQQNNSGDEDQAADDTLLWEQTPNDSIENLEITEDSISISVANDLGYFSIDIPLDSDTLEQILEVTIKKMNKIKSLIQNLK